jgi:hypothetical protein
MLHIYYKNVCKIIYDQIQQRLFSRYTAAVWETTVKESGETFFQVHFYGVIVDRE